MLTDPQSLQACRPGCKRLTEVGADEFEAMLEIGVGPIKGAFGGKILMREKNPPLSYKLVVEGSEQPDLFAGTESLRWNRRRITKRPFWLAAMRRSAALLPGLASVCSRGWPSE